VFNNETLLITGGTGTFGNAVVRRFLGTELKESAALAGYEKKQDDMRRALGNTKVKFYTREGRHCNSLVPAMKGVDLVFHAAPLKQVPSCEFFPYEAVHATVCPAGESSPRRRRALAG